MKKIRKINKVIAFVLALAFVLGMSSPAFAEPVENPADMALIPLDKAFLLGNDDTVSPAETFEFTIAFDSARDTQYANAAVPIPYFGLDGQDNPVLTGTVAFAEGEASLLGNTKTINLTMPNYDHVGVFTYKLTETENDTAGVGYDGRDLFLKVYVINKPDFGDEEYSDATELIRYAVLYELNEADGIIKVKGFENDYSAGNLNITKEVTGNMGEKDRYFGITVTLTKPAGKDISTVSVVYAGGNYSSDVPVTFDSEKGIATLELEIKHGDTIAIKNLPYGATWEVEEDDYTGEGYTIHINEDQMSYGEDGNESVTADVEGALATAAIVNHKEQDVDTGIILENLPYIMILVIVTGGLVGFTLKKRRSNIEL